MTARLPDWYPQGIPSDLTASPYGPPNPQTLRLFTDRLTPGSTILDVAGGYGRYAIPLAEAGYDVTVVDIDEAHLAEAKRRALGLPEGSGQVRTLQADVVADGLPGESYDAALCAGFIYLAPRDIIRRVVRGMFDKLGEGGLSVIEFATNRDRRDAEGRSLVGADEHNYTPDEARLYLKRLHKEGGIATQGLTKIVIHLTDPYYLHNDLLIVHGIKT